MKGGKDSCKVGSGWCSQWHNQGRNCRFKVETLFCVRRPSVIVLFWGGKKFKKHWNGVRVGQGLLSVLPQFSSPLGNRKFWILWSFFLSQHRQSFPIRWHHCFAQGQRERGFASSRFLVGRDGTRWVSAGQYWFCVCSLLSVIV